MKKLFLNSFGLTLLPLTTISCTKTDSPESINTPQSKKQKLYQNEQVNKMLNIFTNSDINKRNIYISQQQNQSYAKYNELKYAFVYDPIFILKSVHNTGGEYNFLANTSKNVIKNTLSQDWYWTLDNIQKFYFIFNPYGDRYKTFEKEKKWFEQVKNNFGSLIAKINDPNPTSLIKIPFVDIEQTKKYNHYINKEIWYLIFDYNKALRIWKYEHNNSVFIQITTDLFVFEKNLNHNEIKSKLQTIESNIHHKRVKEFAKKYEEEKLSAIEFEEEFNEEEFIKHYIDSSFMEFQGLNQYNYFLTQVLNEMHKGKDELNIFRFSMRFVDDQI
ncbi:lipoprotein [Mycoplasmopsis californica]|uniref:Lipoprotein n=1 Tax=Mycoplasmopsis californica TaxID=2113 RepID=A0A059XW40_9BACT|nr:aromatic motif membrane protein [Mycoplasmopsis californica]AIA29551.1 lipoprotein [Mycoplasmopsis californica]